MTDIVRFLDQPTAIVGTTGAGKTFAAKGGVEALIRAKRSTIILDPTGAWWGLRAGAKEGEPGLPVMIFGGEHADVPIDPTHEAGTQLGEALANRAELYAIIDTSEMTGGQKMRFLTPFLESLYAKNKAVLHLIVDEADEIAAQRLADGEQRLFGVFDRIVRRGRLKGFRPLMITQRPAVIHKNVLSQIGTLIALKLTSPQDRKAIEDWVKGNADADQAREVMKSLPTLSRGEGWIWSPALEVLERLNFPPITTYDSSRTPEPGDVITSPALAAVDVKALIDALGQSSEPESSRAGNGEREKSRSSISEDERKRIHDLAFSTGREEGYREGKSDGMWIGYHSQMLRVMDALTSAPAIVGDQDALRDAHERMKLVARGAAPVDPPSPKAHPEPVRPQPNQAAPKRDVPRPASDHTGISPSARKIVEVVQSVYPRGLSLAAAAKRAGLSVKSSAYRKHLEQASASPLIADRGDGRFVASAPPAGISVPAGIEGFKQRLPSSYARMLEAIHSFGGETITRDEIADAAGVSRTSSGLGSGLRELLQLELIEQRNGGYAISADFLEAADA